MSNCRWIVLAVGIIVVAVQTLTLAAKEAEEPPRKDQESLEVRYARAQLALAEANLHKVLRMNLRVRGAVPREVAAEYQQDIEIAETRLQAAKGGDGRIPFQAWLRRAESLVGSAELQWKNALATNRRTPGTVDSIDVERLRLRAEVARLNLERGQLLVDASTEAQLQWQVDLLDNEVQRLNEEVLRKPPPSQGYYPLWWY